MTNRYTNVPKSDNKPENVVIIRGGGDLASGTIHRLYRCGYRLLVLECEKPTAIRRMVSFCEAVYDGQSSVEGVLCRKVDSVEECEAVWKAGEIPLMADTEGTAVIYLKNKELEVSFDTLNNVNEFPDKYELYIEPETAAKDWYLKELEQIFCERGDFTRSKQSRINGIAACMQKWYRSLPQYTVVTDHYSSENILIVKVLRSLLKRAEINPRELIFVRIPDGMETDDYEQAIVGVKNAVSEMNGKLDELLTQINIQIKKEFHVEKDTNLKACLIEWYERQSQASKQYILSTGISKFMSYLDQLATNDEEEIVRKLSRIVTDMYVEDWKDTSIVQFQEELHQIRVEIENIQDASAATDSKSRFILQDAEGNEVMKYFDAEITDSTSIYLQNMIEEALDDFGDTLEMNQKVAVLVQAIRKLL